MRLSIGQMSESVRHYRIKQPGELCGFEYHATNGKTVDHWISLLEKYKAPEIIHTNAIIGESRSYVDACQEAGSRIVADVDDLYDDVPPGNDAYAHSHGHRKGAYESLLKGADTVTCSTPFLADRFGGQLAPNFLNLDLWNWPSRPKKSDEVVVCIPSANGRAEDYLAIHKAMAEIAKLPNVKIILMNFLQEWALPLPAGKIVFCRWIPFEEYPRMLRWIAPDVLISPLVHHDFNLAKSNIKWLEAGAVGSCFVGERWGEYSRTIEDGVDGILADGEAEWTERLRDVCLDVDLRHRVAQAGQKSVSERWTWPALQPSWEAALLGGTNEQRNPAASLGHGDGRNGYQSHAGLRR